MSLQITNIQRFCLHDGPGIRTTVFLKGCFARCPWCANPETISFAPTVFYREKRCVIKSGSCFLNPDCPILRGESTQNITREDVDKCKANALEIVGLPMDDEQLIQELLADKIYYGREGGVTFSGGEALAQADQLVPVLERLRRLGVRVAIETSLMAPIDNLKKVVDLIDYYLVDVKSLEKEIASRVLGIDIDVYMANLEYLTSKIDKSALVWRMPVAKGVTDGAGNVKAIKETAERLGINKMEIFGIHNLAETKYGYMGRPFTPNEKPSDEELQAIKTTLEVSGKIRVTINRI